MVRSVSKMLLLCVLVSACATREPVISEKMLAFEGPMPADLSGAWERDYTRGDDAYAVLGQVLYRLQRYSGDAGGPNGYGSGMVSERHRAAVYAIGRLADEITRVQVLTISQSENEISIARKDDYAIHCAFYDGLTKPLESSYGIETCGWDGDNLVSYAQLLNGLQITHRFTMSPDAKQLRVITTVNSSKSPVPFTLSRYYRKFKAPTSDFNCVETLSMKRVCSTGDLEL